MKRFSLTIFLLLSLYGCSCSKEQPQLDKSDIMWMIYNVDNNAQEILPKDMNSGVKCEDYGPGCVRGYQGRVIGMDVTFIEFESEEHAIAEAQRINGYYLQRWLFDDVAGEPVLEKFFKKHLGVKRPGEELEPQAKNN